MLSEAEAVYLEFARRTLNEHQLELFFEDNVRFHAPQWHECGLLGHTLAAILVAQELAEKTRVDVVPAATLHDVGKIEQFHQAILRANRGGNPANAYTRHEQSSARLARPYLDPRDCRIITHHGLAYQARADTIVRKKLNRDPEAVRRWLALCTADAGGKGFTQKQQQQRPMVAEKFREIAEMIGLTSDDHFLSVCCQMVEKWQIPHAKIKERIKEIRNS